MASLLLLKSMLYANAMIRKSKKKKKLKSSSRQSEPKKLDLSLCRVCNGDKGEIPIFDNISHPNIPEDIQHFTGVTVTESDNLPKMMCQSCLDLLNGCIMFRDMCRRNNQHLIELSLKKEQSYEDRTEELDCLVSEMDTDLYNAPSPLFPESEEWECHSCNLQFYDLSSYNVHVKECLKKTEGVKEPREKTKPCFLCDVCGKTANSKASLLVHMGIHGNVFPFKCEQCPYQGRTMDLLKVHKRSHLAEKPFKCTQCGKATTTASNLAKHMGTVHSTTKPFKCQYCDKAFSFQHDTKRHIRDTHLRQGTVQCDLCFKKFNTTKILRGHRRKVHKIKGVRQGRLPSYLQCRTEDNIDCDYHTY